jgi:hypothetical protein
MPHAALYGVGSERAFFNVIHKFDVDANAAPGLKLHLRHCERESEAHT